MPGIRMQASASSSPTISFGVSRIDYSVFARVYSPYFISFTCDIFSSCDFRSLSRAIRIYVERISSSACYLENQWWSQSRRPRQTIDSHQLSKSCVLVNPSRIHLNRYQVLLLWLFRQLSLHRMMLGQLTVYFCWKSRLRKASATRTKKPLLI